MDKRLVIIISELAISKILVRETHQGHAHQPKLIRMWSAYKRFFTVSSHLEEQSKTRELGIYPAVPVKEYRNGPATLNPLSWTSCSIYKL